MNLPALRRHLAGRGEWWWVPLLYALALVVIYRALWWQGGQATAFGWDVPAAYGPNLEYLGHDLAGGHLSWWNPYDKGGYAVVGDPECDRYNPLAALFIGASALLGGPWWLIHVKVLAYHLVAACALHLFLRSRGLSSATALLGGLALIASTPLLVHKASMVMWPMVFVPLAWLAIDRVIAEPTVRRGVGLGGALGLIVTGGSPPGIFYAALLVLPYGVLRLVAAGRAGRLRRVGLALVPAATVVTLIALVVLVPLADAITQSTRAGVAGGRFALDGGQSPGEILPALLVPTAGKLESYFGGVALVLALAGLLLRPRTDGSVAIWWAVVAAVGVVLMFGALTPVLPFLVEHVPGFGRLRVPGRYKLVSAWAMAPLVAMGAAAVIEQGRGRIDRRLWGLLGGLLLLAMVLLVVPQVAMPASPRSKLCGLVPVLLAVVVIALLRRGAARWQPALLAALALAIVVDAPSFLHTPGSPPIADPQRPHADEPAMLATLGDVAVAYRLYDEFVFAERVGLRRQVRNFRGYPSVDQLSQHRYMDVLEFARRDPAILTDFNVRWILHAPHYLNGMSTNFLLGPPTPAQGFDQRGAHTFEAQHPAPLAAWYGALRVVPSPDVLPAMRASQGADGQRRYAVMDATPGELAPLLATAPTPSRDVIVTAYQADRIALAVDAPAAGVVVLNELWDPGWQVTVDGAPAHAQRVNYVLRGVAVPTGAHTIVWTFEPRLMRWLLAGVALGWLAVIAALVWPRRRRVPA